MVEELLFYHRNLWIIFYIKCATSFYNRRIENKSKMEESYHERNHIMKEIVFTVTDPMGIHARPAGAVSDISERLFCIIEKFFLQQ